MMVKRGYALALVMLIFLLSYMHFAYATSQFARPDQDVNVGGFTLTPYTGGLGISRS